MGKRVQSTEVKIEYSPDLRKVYNVQCELRTATMIPVKYLFMQFLMILNPLRLSGSQLEKGE